MNSRELYDKIEFYQFGDLYKEAGIKFLTGEACALSMRMLCEVTAETMQRYINYTGIQGIDGYTLPTSRYNDSSRYAVMLTRQSMNDLVILYLLENNEAVYILREPKNSNFQPLNDMMVGSREDLDAFIAANKGMFGYYDEEFKYIHGEFYDVGRRYTFNENPRRGMNNIHAMSGMSH